MIKDLQDILKTEAGRQLKDFLLEHYSALNSLDAVKEMDDPIAQAVEVKATKKAVGILRMILSKIVDINAFEEKSKVDENNLIV